MPPHRHTGGTCCTVSRPSRSRIKPSCRLPSRRIPDIATIFGISDRQIPGLNGSNLVNEPFFSSFRRCDIGRHHTIRPPQIDDAARGPGWRVETRLDGLLADGSITREQHEAAAEWRRWAETAAPHRTQCWEVRVDASLTVGADAAALRRVRMVLSARAPGLGPQCGLRSFVFKRPPGGRARWRFGAYGESAGSKRGRTDTFGTGGVDNFAVRRGLDKIVLRMSCS